MSDDNDHNADTPDVASRHAPTHLPVRTTTLGRIPRPTGIGGEIQFVHREIGDNIDTLSIVALRDGFPPFFIGINDRWVRELRAAIDAYEARVREKHTARPKGRPRDVHVPGVPRGRVAP